MELEHHQLVKSFSNEGINMLSIGPTLKELRTSSNLTLKELAIKSGFDSSYISKIENGERSPTIESLEKICKALGVSLNTFFILSSTEEDESLVELSSKLKSLVKKNLSL